MTIEDIDFGHSDLAKELYAQAKIDTAEEVA